jgi:hypothetical protein
LTAKRELDAITYRRLGLLLVAIGLISAAGTMFGYPALYRLWPVLTLSLGIGLIGMFARKERKATLHLAFGEYLVLFSGLALYCSFTTWRNLGRLWPLLIAFLGVVFATLLIFCRRSRLIPFFALLFLLLSAALFGMFTYGAEYWWSIPVATGLSILAAGARA